MAKIRVYELARELGITSAELRGHLKEMAVEVTSASSSLDEATATTVRELLSQKLEEAPVEEEAGLELIKIPTQATVRDFAQALDTDIENIAEEFERLGKPHLPNQILELEVAQQIAKGWGFKLEVEKPKPETPPAKEKVVPKETEEIAPSAPRIVVIEKEAGRHAERRMKMPPPLSATAAPTAEAPVEIEEEPEEVEEEVVEEVPEEIWRPEAPPNAPERPAVITVMGHVDHGKTTLLDFIRRSKVTEGEAGGITQHIGAYQVEVNDKKITFLDTPGHEAFTSIRARGARVTDIAIIVVGADDGVKPQTLEAIDHARAAEVPIVIAINKIDRPQANIERVRRQLSEAGLNPVDWGGDTEMIPISALDGTGVDTLLDTVLAMAELQELRAAQDRPAAGTIIESSLDRRRGPLATVIVQEGILRVGDALSAGVSWGKVRMMMDDTGKRLREASPSTPVSIAGISPVPEAGDIFRVKKSDKIARRDAEESKLAQEEAQRKAVARTSLQDIYSQIEAGEVKELNLVLKADTQGSLDAIAKSLVTFEHPEVKVVVLHSGIGEVSESDVLLAAASKGIVIGFQVGLDAQAKRSGVDEQVEIRLYSVIYDVLEDIRQALVGLLPVQEEEVALGEAEVKALFRSSRIGTVAGCLITTGKMVRNSQIRIIREAEIIYTGRLTSLRHVKEDMQEMQSGMECGIVIAGFNDLSVGDIIEAFEIREVRRQVL